MNLSPLPIQKFFDNNGRPLVRGLLFTYEAGTSIKIATYKDSTGGTPNTNPIVLDFRGECRLWIDPLQAYKFVLAPRNDTDPPTHPIWTVDNITAAPQAFDNASVDTGSVNNISLIIRQISSPVAFTRVVFKAANTNTGATTLQINGGTARPLTWQNVAQLTGGEVQANGLYEAIFDGAEWQLQGPTLLPTQMRTADEVAAGTTPINYSKFPSPWKDISRFVTDNTGATDVSAQFANAIAAETNIIVPDGAYNLGTTGIVLPQDLTFTGSSRYGTQFLYAGTGIAFDAYGRSSSLFERFQLICSNVAATGFRFGNGSLHCQMNNIHCDGVISAANTGAGLLLLAGSPGSFSGNFLVSQCLFGGFKFGLRAVGTDTGVNTWTTVSGVDLFILGRAAGVVAGGRGIWFDANTNGVGSRFRGGSIEFFETGALHESAAGAFGFDLEMDMEGNTTEYVVGASFTGKIRTPIAGNAYVAGSNSTTNRWYQERQLNGEYVREQYRNNSLLTYNATGDGAIFGVYRGASIIGGGSPDPKFQVMSSDSGESDVVRNHVRIINNRQGWATASPASGTWARGDVVWNSAVAAAGSPGWICTTAGTPGTWKTMAVVSA